MTLLLLLALGYMGLVYFAECRRAENYLKLNKITLTKIIFSLRDLAASNFYKLRGGTKR